VADLASRIEGNANKNQILIPKSIIKLLNDSQKEKYKFSDSAKYVMFKGIRDQQEIFEVAGTGHDLRVDKNNELRIWENYLCNATFHLLDDPNIDKIIKEKYFKLRSLYHFIYYYFR